MRQSIESASSTGTCLVTDRPTCGCQFPSVCLRCIESSCRLFLRPTEEVAPDGYQFLMNLKEYDPKQLISDEKSLFKCMSELIGHEINVRKVVFLSEHR